MTTPQDKAAEALRLAETIEWRVRDLTFKEYDTVAAMLREYAAKAQPAEAAHEGGWDASKIKQPDWSHVQAAYIAGAVDARENPEATSADFARAADGYTKRVFEEVDPVSEHALRTESWAQPAEAGRVPLTDWREIATKLAERLKSIKQTTMHARRFGPESLANYRHACVSAEEDAEEALRVLPKEQP